MGKRELFEEYALHTNSCESPFAGISRSIWLRKPRLCVLSRFPSAKRDGTQDHLTDERVAIRETHPGGKVLGMMRHECCHQGVHKGEVPLPKCAVDVVTVEIGKLDAARILQSEVKKIAGHKSVQIVEALADFSEIRQRPANGQVWVLF